MLEGLLWVRLNREGLQPAVHGGFGDSNCRGRSPGTPVASAIGGSGLQGSIDHLGVDVILVVAMAASAELVVESFQPQFQVPLPPLANAYALSPIRLVMDW